MRFSGSATLALIGAIAAVVVAVGSASGASQPTPSPGAHGHAVGPAIENGSGVILFSNSSNDAGIGISSQNFDPAYATYDDAAADDFSVPANTTWHVTEIDVTGIYYNGPGRADSETV